MLDWFIPSSTIINHKTSDCTSINIADEKPQEACGLFAIYSNSPETHLATVLDAGLGIQHRGQQGAGIYFHNNSTGQTTTHLGDGLLRDVISQGSVRDKLSQVSANFVILHIRYGTNGGYDNYNLQPCIVPIWNQTEQAQQADEVVVAHNGQFVSSQNLRKHIPYDLPKNASDTLLFTHYLATIQARSSEERVKIALQSVPGAYGLLIGIGNKLFGARDSNGIRPLILGKLGESYVLASETYALEKIGARVERSLGPGEIICIENGELSIVQKRMGAERPCGFEYAYFSHVVSQMENSENTSTPDAEVPSFGIFREECGRLMAEQMDIPKNAVVIGVPDSGIAFASGFARSAGVHLRHWIVRPHHSEQGRIFQDDKTPDKMNRQVLQKLKLQSTSEWKGSIVYILDDSMVRGTVSTELIKAIFTKGVIKVHIVLGFPKVRNTCHLGVSMRTQQELIAHRWKGDEKLIAREIGATSAHFISPEIFAQALKNVLGKDQQVCMGCVTGNYPVSPNARLKFGVKHGLKS